MNKDFEKQYEDCFRDYFSRVNRKFYRILGNEKEMYDPISRVHDKRKAGIPHLRDSWVKKTRRRNGFYMTPKRHDIKLRVDNTSIPYKVYTQSSDRDIRPNHAKSLKFYNKYTGEFVAKKKVRLEYTTYNDRLHNIVISAARQAIAEVGWYTLTIDKVKSVDDLRFLMDELERLQ